MFRQLIEKLSRRVVLKRHLPTEFGGRSLFVSPEGGGLRYWKTDLSSADPMLLQVVRQWIKPGQIVWDVGGNVGLFSFSSAHQVGIDGQVAVFEPDLYLAALLRKSADANPDLNIDIFAVAVSDSAGLATFNIAERARATNFLDQSSGSTQAGGVRQKVSVPTLPLDTFMQWYPVPHFIKIDVEGAEHLVFQGMKKLLRTIQPIILCEVSAHNWSLLNDILHQNAYQVFDAEHLPNLLKANEPCFNILAIPLQWPL